MLSNAAVADDGGAARGALCAAIGAKLASVSVASCRRLALVDSGGRSVEQRPILLREYSPVSGRTPLGRVLLIGGTHGDEYASVSVVFKWMEILEQHHSGLFHWQVVPLLNPDGLLRPDSTRTNANGVDLNRNMPTPDWMTGWEREWERRGRSPRRYPGRAPASEPETRWLTRQIDRFHPDAIVALHTPYGVVDADGPAGGPSRLGSLRLRKLGNYTGSLGRYAGVYKGIPVVTIELKSSGRMPSPTEIGAIWSDLVSWLRGVMPKRPLHAAVEEDGPEG
ncbi:hypothetical protein JCM17961_34180 [Endothiovibrio diazotrophicus]